MSKRRKSKLVRRPNTYKEPAYMTKKDGSIWVISPKNRKSIFKLDEWNDRKEEIIN